jgi:hypothetical protein
VPVPTNLSVLPTHAQFLEIYKRLRRNKALFDRTPIVFCEGDSWFSTPLAMNILDWLVFPTPAEEEQGVPILGRGGLFYRDEQSGSLATEMFTAKGITRLMKAYKAFDFDVALLSGGGNDFVGRFLQATFKNKPQMTVSEAFGQMPISRRFQDVRSAYDRLLTAMVKERPNTPILGHTYAYPIRMGKPADLTLVNVGAVAILKKNAGPWIGPHLRTVLPALEDQKAFARRLIDGFAENVLFPLADDPRFRGVFRVVDLRADCPNDPDWFDEMHPTGATFHRLSKKFEAEIRNLFVLP